MALPAEVPYALKPVEGWWCPCTGPGADVGHHASECDRRVRVATTVPTVPGWKPPRGAWLDEAGAEPVEDGAESWRARPPIVACRPVIGGAEMPRAALQLGERLNRAGVLWDATYAKGWGKRLGVPGEDGKRHFEPWPVESVAVRAPRVCAVAWVRAEGEVGWKADAAFAVWGGRIYAVSVTDVTKLIESMTEATTTKRAG